MIVSGGLSGGISSTIAGGDFWQGMQQGVIVSGLNHLMHMGLDNGYDKDGNKINGNGGDVMDIQYDDDGSVLEIRAVEVRFWEKVGAASSVPVEEFGIRRLRIATGQVASVGGAFDVFGLKEVFWSFFSGNDNVPYDFKPMGAAFGGGKGKSFTSDKSFNLLTDKFLKKAGINAHELKYEYLGKNAKIARYDLYRHTKTGEVLIIAKGGKGMPINTGIFIK
ncbi:polymorphic toxin type 33 domain-containing protein [Myroides odoratus]